MSEEVVVNIQVVDLSRHRFSGYTALRLREGGSPVPADVPDHAMLFCTNVESKVGSVDEGGRITVGITFRDPLWFTPDHSVKNQAPPTPDGYMTSHPVRCSQIDDRAILEFLALHQGEWSTWGNGHSMPTVRDAMPLGVPEKLQLAKMRRLIKRDLVGGCVCGCRGDFEITDKGLAYIGQPRTKSGIAV